MNKNEIINCLTKGHLTIAFDTNALFGDKRLKKLCTNINRINRFNDNHQLKLVVPAPAHAEKLRQLKQKLGEQRKKYHHEFVIRNLRDLGINIISFEPHHAEAVADLFYQQFPTDEAWQAFKRQRCIDCLQLGHVEETMVGSGKKCSATVDWLIAGYAYVEDCLLVTDDKGKEFKNLKTTTFKTLEAAVEEFLQQLLLPLSPFFVK